MTKFARRTVSDIVFFTALLHSADLSAELLAFVQPDLLLPLPSGHQSPRGTRKQSGRGLRADLAIASTAKELPHVCKPVKVCSVIS